MDTLYAEINDGEVRLWLEQSDSICMKAITEHGDPVELTANQAKNLVKELLKMIAEIEKNE